jgi:FkbM family methyltransferase
MLSLERLKWRIKPFIEGDCYLGFFAIELARRVHFFLPHDPDFYGFRHFIRKGAGGQLFLDVGANNGLSALSFRRISRDIPILSLEPNPVHLKSLTDLKRRDPHFDFKLVGAGDQPKVAELFMPFLGRLPLHTTASLSREWAESVRETLVPRRYWWMFTIQSREIKIVPIDDLDLSPSIVKIDTEGCEHAVLLGAKRTIERHRPFMMIEHAFRENFPTAIPELLAGWGYRCVSYDRERDAFVSGEGENRNMFFIPEEKAKEVPLL